MRYTADLRERVVREIVEQGVFVEEVMRKHDIRAKATVVRWVKEYLKKIEREKD